MATVTVELNLPLLVLTLMSSPAMLASPTVTMVHQIYKMLTLSMLDRILMATVPAMVTMGQQRIHLLTVKIFKKSHLTAMAMAKITAMAMATSTITAMVTAMATVRATATAMAMATVINPLIVNSCL